MKRRFYALMLVVAMFGMTLVGCGSETTDTTNATDIATLTESLQEETTEEIMHEHSFVYEFDTETRHNVTCADETCTYAETETCSYGEAYVCELCNNKHDHTIINASNGDGTHSESCAVCGYLEAVECVLDADYVCVVCGWSHEHECTVSGNDDATHSYSCKYNACPYSYDEECVYTVFECICGNVYPWENDVRYFDADEQTTYYAQKTLNIYRYPSLDSEVIGTLSTDQMVKGIGTIFYGSGANYESYLVTEDGGFVSEKFHINTNRWDLRVAKTTQVIVRCNDNKTIYESYDAALESVCGYSWSTVKQTFSYNDYDSQGLPFMNSYSKMGTGITVSTRDGSIPYNCIINEVTYYFE